MADGTVEADAEADMLEDDPGVVGVPEVEVAAVFIIPSASVTR